MEQQVSTIDPSQDERWDAFVEAHPYGWICHTSAWKEVLEDSYKHIKPKYLVLTDQKNGNIRAALPLCQVKSRITGNRLISLPFATLCDPLIDSEDEFKALFDVSIGLKDDLGCRYIEVRAFKSADSIGDSRLCLVRNYKHHSLALDREPQELMKRFHRTCIRQRIQRAEKSKLKVHEGESETDLKEFYRIYLKTRRRLRLPPQPYRFISSLWQKLYPLGFLTLLLAQHDGRAIGGIILFKYKERVSAEYAAMDDDFFNLSPNHLLFWIAIKKAQEEGYRVFDFGRTDPNNQGLMDFKSRWGTKTIDLIQAFSPISAAQQIGAHGAVSQKILGALCEKAPDLGYRAIGNFCYRHMG
jgi:hypothetical protein